MKFSKLGLLTLLISLFILNSCKNPDGVGLGIDEDTQLNGTLLTDTNLVITTVPEDTISAGGTGVRPLSYFKDPVFGTTETNIAAVINLPGNTVYTLPSGTISIDSVLLVLPYAEGFYGDSLTSKYKINVYQLAEKVLAQTYYNTKQWSHEPTLLGTKTFFARPHDSITVSNIRTAKADTPMRVKAQLRIPIAKDFINTNLFAAPTNVLSNVTAFQNAVKGLYLTLDKSVTTGPGGNIMLSIDTSAKINVYYKRKNGTTIDTSMVSLPTINSVTQVKHTYSAQVQAALNNTSPNGLVYLQGILGTRAKVTFPKLKQTLDALGDDIILNRVELVVKAEPGTTTPFAPISRLTLYKYDIAKQRVLLQDASSSDPRATIFGGYYTAAKGEYHFIITSFIQDLYRGKTVDYGTYLAPTDAASGETINIQPALTVAQRTIAIGKNSADRIRLNIIYTKIKK